MGWRIMDKLEFGYNHGFTRGLMKVKEQIDGQMADDLKRHGMRFNVKTLGMMLDCMIENRELLRDNPRAFLRCKTGGGFEVFAPK